MSRRKQCAVCGDTCAVNVRRVWRRDSDGKTVNICMACAEAGRVNAQSIDNYTGKATIYDPSTDNAATSYYRGRSNLGTQLREAGGRNGRMAIPRKVNG